MAIVSGVNMLLLPQTFVACCQARMLSRTGRCHTFDESACGYARGEGCGSLILDRNQLHRAELLGTAINQDGRSANLTSPHGPSQVAVVRKALDEAHVNPSVHDMVETHGTGTELGDPIEIGALRVALGRREITVALGAVKTNIGHLEGGAGMAGLMKLVSQRQHVPPNAHLRTLNRHVHADADVDFPAGFLTETVQVRQVIGHCQQLCR